MKIKWQLSRINDDWKMTKANYKSGYIEQRELYWWEHFRYFWRQLITGVTSGSDKDNKPSR